MWRAAVAYKVGVICRSCGRRIEIEDEYIPGISAMEMAAAFYKPVAEKFADFASVAWQQILTCGNPDCGKTHEYSGHDLLLYDG
jgi:hypothetical protein